PLTFELTARYLDDVVLVEEKELASAVLDLMERDHMLAEGAGAAAVAGMLKLSPALREKLGDRVACAVVSGGNMDVNLLNRLIPKGLIYSGRLMRLSVRLSDRPGRLAELLQVIAGAGANLLEVNHNRLFGVTTKYEEVEVNLDVET